MPPVGKAWCIGLTGGIACGKSTVGRMLEELGAYRIDADELAHRVLRAREVAQRVARRWPRVATPAGGIDRRRLGEIVFADPGERRALEAIVHPPVRELLRRELAAARAAVVVAEVPLLFESGLEGWFDRIWAVTATPDQQLARLTGQGLSLDQARRRLAAGLPPAHKARRAHAVIDNSGSLERTREQVERLWGELGAPGPEEGE
ncbi:MAG: dephospho-CoA kinase [Thermaerobacter sp.]|jgi:dephospho-CoA kinase|nr:dephospho-CoA kinase [Thermaerobacter sp.]